MKYYELLTVIPARYTDEETKVIEGSIGNLLKNNGSEVLRVLNLGKIKMAYSIGDTRHGIYLMMVFGTEPKNIDAIKKALALFDEVVRYEVSVTDELALNRNYSLVAYQEPLTEAPREESFSRPLPKFVPKVEPIPVPVKQMTSEEIEQQIDKILEEKIV